MLTLAFLTAHAVAPTVQQAFLSVDRLRRALPATFGLPQLARPELFPPLGEISWLLLVTAPVTLVAIELLGGYGRLLDSSMLRLIATAVLSQTVGISVCALIVFALKLSASSRVVVFTYGLVCAVGLVAYRGSLLLYQRRRRANGAYARNVLLIGDKESVGRIAAHIRRQASESEFRILGWLTTDARTDGRDQDVALPPPLGSVHELGGLLVHQPIHDVIAIHASAGPAWLHAVIDHCAYFRVRLRLVPQALVAPSLRNAQLAFHGGDPLGLPEIVLTPPRFDTDALFAKRLIDIAVSAVLLVALAPLFLLIAAAIKITTPYLPVLYPWRVIGLNGRPFTGYKFTTMVADADEQKQHLLEKNEMTGPVFKLQHDPRVTPLGRALRKFSLNELPQIWSVLKGDMSLVGPRPALPHELQRYELWHKRKLSVKPGVTCLWQVSGRNRINDFDDWVRLDLEYIDRWSLGLDARILARTVWAVVSGSGS